MRMDEITSQKLPVITDHDLDALLDIANAEPGAAQHAVDKLLMWLFGLGGMMSDHKGWFEELIFGTQTSEGGDVKLQG